MILFREHRGSLDESMETCIIINSFDQLYKIIRDELSPYIKVNKRDVTVEYYCNDTRINWPNTHIVTVQNFGVIGYTSGKL